MHKKEYDVIVIGGGAAGLTAAGFAANIGAKTMMIEEKKLGGDCTWTGCVPSKILLKAAKVAQQMRQAGTYGLTDTKPTINFQKLIKHVHAIRQDIYDEADAPANFKAMGIDVVSGRASFRDDHNVDIAAKDGDIRTVSARYFFVCAGASPAIPLINGLDSVDYFTSESFFEKEQLPERLIIIGAGPIGTEMAQAMNRLGSEVTVVDQAERILTKDDPELATRMQRHLQEEGVKYMLNAEIVKAEQKGGEKQVSLAIEDRLMTVGGGVLLLATGRQPNTDRLNLDAAGVCYSKKGIGVNAKCQTNVPHIYACGDITGDYFFTHMSEHMAKVAITNALLKIPMKTDHSHVPWCTYCDPELAHVGKTEQQLKNENSKYETYLFPYNKLDRAIVDSEKAGIVKVFAKKWSGKILGVSILGARAGELISEYVLAMKNGITLRNVADTIHPYPSFGQAARRVADQWYIRARPAWLLKGAQKIFGYRGEIPDLNDSDKII